MFDVNAWREPVLAGLDAAQRLWLELLQRTGLTDTIDGQAAWPHEQRFAAQVLAYDDSLLKQLLWSAGAVGVAALCLLWALVALWLCRRAARKVRLVSCVPQVQVAGAPLVNAASAAAPLYTKANSAPPSRAGRESTAEGHAPVLVPWWRVLMGPVLLGSAVLWLAPWPAAHLVLQPAVPSSFHASPTGVSAQSIVQGQKLYLAHCASCHGETGRADGPRASEGDTWPPMLAGGLVGKRLEGELLWRIRHGWHKSEDPHVTPSQAQHHFAQALSTEATWQVLDFLQANVAGQNLAEAGEWPQPVKLPTTDWLCAQSGLRHAAAGQLGEGGPSNPRPVRPVATATEAENGALQARGDNVGTHFGVSFMANARAAIQDDPSASQALWLTDLPVQRLRVVLGTAHGPLPKLQPDPRLLTLLAQPPDSTHLEHDALDCHTQSGLFQQAMAVVLGVAPDALAGHQLLVDRDGWLRARSTPDSVGWREGDLVCKPANDDGQTSQLANAANPQASGLDALIARMDAAPLVASRAGFLHR